MKPFRLPPWRKKQIRDKERRQSAIIRRTVTDMESVMRTAVDTIIDNSSTGKFTEPDLGRMYDVSELFYRSVIGQAWQAAKHEKQVQQGKRRLAKYNDPRIPSLRDLESIFRDKRFWPSIMKRSSQVTDRLRKAYIQKLRRKFRELHPRIASGAITPADAKKQMMQAWDASKSRVDSIFRTETTNYFGRAQTAYFKDDPEIIGYLFDCARRPTSTKICKSRHGLIYRPGTKGPTGLAYNTPSLHYGCGSHLIALANTPYNRKMVEDPDRDPIRRAVEPLPPGWRK